MKRFLAVLSVMVLIPYVTTLAWTGRLGGADDPGIVREWEDGMKENRSPAVIIRQNGREFHISVEEFLVPVLAAQIPADFGPETLKAQAILARTYIYREMDGAEEIPEEALDMDALSRSQMDKLWGKSNFSEMYGNIRTAVRETEGMYAVYEGTVIEPYFCRAASGKTRAGDQEHPYLIQADSPGDLLADGFLMITVFTAKTMAERINGIPDSISVGAGQLPEEIQIVERDEAGYVKQVQIGQKTYSGEDVQYALGLPSSCYSFENMDGKIRVTCKGIGHGYGFSQAGAREYEKAGHDYRWLLDHYFQNVEILNAKN